MNLPEPSGSSPPEKPPGRKRIWAWAALGHQVHGLGDVPCGEVLHDHDLRHGPRLGHGPGAVVLAVGAGEDGDEHPGLGGLDKGFLPAVALVNQGGDGPLALGDVAGVDRFQLALIGRQQLLGGEGLAVPGEVAGLRGGTQGQADGFLIIGQLQDDGAVGIGEELVQGAAGVKGQADGVTEGHLHDPLCHPAVAGG